MFDRRMTTATAILACVTGAALVAAGCEGPNLDEALAPDDAETQKFWISPAPTPPPLPPPSTLVPPEPFVLGDDGITHLSLEQAGVFNPDGKAWAIALGKALFWDEQVGSDGNACASCHFNAGADTRLSNQLNPGSHDLTRGPAGDIGFGSIRSDTGHVLPGRMPSGGLPDSSYRLKPTDMPLHQLADETDRNSPIVTTTNDRVSSFGAFAAKFRRLGFMDVEDSCSRADGSVFHVGRSAARQVEPRNSPTTINAGFSFRNFWDGRANNLYNGVGVFGLRDVEDDATRPHDPRRDNRLIVAQGGAPTLAFLMVENDSLASQSMGPPENALEMSCDKRTFPQIGRKLLTTIPLLNQRVSKDDSMLGSMASKWGHGLDPRWPYAELIRRAFAPKYWALPGRYRIANGKLHADQRNGFTQMETNFSMFFGLAVAAYEATLVSDKSEFDMLQTQGKLTMTPRFGGRIPGGCVAAADVDPLLVRGCTIFARAITGPDVAPPPDGIRGGGCFVCHNGQGGGAARTIQTLLGEGQVQEGENVGLFLTVADVHGVPDLRDQGFSNIGLRPVLSDTMSGQTDPYGQPLSFGRQLWQHLDGKPNALLDPPLRRAVAAGNVPTRREVGSPPANGTFQKLEVDGSSKAPSLRNVALTPPYFSWGGYPNLRQVLRLYNRGVNRRDIDGASDPDNYGTTCVSGDNSGTGPLGNPSSPGELVDCNTNTTGNIRPLGLSDCDANSGPNASCIANGHTPQTDDLAALERFMRALTDARVQCDRAPFDHPELHVIAGHAPQDVDCHEERAEDVVFRLPATGASGYAPSSGLCIPNTGDLFAPGMQARSGGGRVVVTPEAN